MPSPRFAARAAAVVRPAEPRLAALDGAGSDPRLRGRPATGGPGRGGRSAAGERSDRGRAGGSRFRVGAAAIGEIDVRLAVPGRHNVADATAAIGALLSARELDPSLPPIEELAAALASFPGMARRLERKGTRVGRARSTTTTPITRPRWPPRSRPLRELPHRRLIAVFQPHLYSRTKALAPRFGRALAAADEIGVLDVYPARELPVGPLEGVSGLAVAERRRRRGSGPPGLVARRHRPGRAAARPRLATATCWSPSAPATWSGSPTASSVDGADERPPRESSATSRSRD